MITKASGPFRIVQVVGQKDARVRLKPPDLHVEDGENRGVEGFQEVQRSRTELWALGSLVPGSTLERLTRSATKLETASLF